VVADLDYQQDSQDLADGLDYQQDEKSSQDRSRLLDDLEVKIVKMMVLTICKWLHTSKVWLWALPEHWTPCKCCTPR